MQPTERASIFGRDSPDAHTGFLAGALGPSARLRRGQSARDRALNRIWQVQLEQWRGLLGEQHLGHCVHRREQVLDPRARDVMALKAMYP